LLPLIGGSNGVLVQVLIRLGGTAQAFGRLPWFAELPLRARRLRPRLLMGFSFVFDYAHPDMFNGLARTW
jgi:hypothetical protein